MAIGELEGAETRVDVGAYGSLALMILIGSTTATAAKIAIRGGLPVGLLPVVRFGVAGLCLWPVVARPLARMWRRDAARLLAASALCVPINQSFFLNGTRLAPTSHVALIYAACPLVVLLLVTMIGQERLRTERLAGVLASVLGVVIIGLGNLGKSGAAGSDAMRGDLLLVGAVLSWGGYLAVNKPLVARHGELPTLAGTFLIGSLLTLPIAAITSPGWSLATVSPVAWLSLGYLALVVSIVGLAGQNFALRRLDASQVATANNVSPILTILWGILLLGETITPALILGGALTLGGALWSSRPAASRVEPTVP